MNITFVSPILPPLPHRSHHSIAGRTHPPTATLSTTSYSRRAFSGTLGSLIALSALSQISVLAQAEPTVSPLQKLQEARARLDAVDGLINDAKWDSIRTLLSRDPVSSTRQACNDLLVGASLDLRGAVVGLREDAISAIRLLDTSVYANVFVGEDRQILGTKVDYEVPRTYLADLKDALDALIDIAM